MAGDWWTTNRPGAFKHASFGKRDGWFLAIQMAMLFATLTSALAILPALDHGGAGIGGGLTRSSAIGVLIYGGWLAGLMGLRRWAIRGLPAFAVVMLVSGVLVCLLPLLQPPPLLPGDTPSIGWFSRISGVMSAILSAVALWRMRGAQFREYFAQAWAH